MPLHFDLLLFVFLQTAWTWSLNWRSAREDSALVQLLPLGPFLGFTINHILPKKSERDYNAWLCPGKQ